MNGREIVGAGTAESDWINWLSRQKVPNLTVQRLFEENKRLVVVAPHPDDEILACGGLLALSAKVNFPISVVAVTDGEGSHAMTDEHQRQSLGEQRVSESCAGLMQLGIDPECVVRLKIPDGSAANNVEHIFLQLEDLFLPGDLVITTWSQDGHPDHEATADAVLRTGCKAMQAPVWMWHWAKPADKKIPWANLMSIEITEDAIHAKKNALAQHHSQIAWSSDRFEPVLIPSIVERAARQHEYFFIAINAC